MKILKIHVRSNEQGTMVYPEGFLTIRPLHMLYCDDESSGICYLLCQVNDEDMAKIKVMDDVEIMTIEDAEAYAATYEPKTIQVTDEGMLRVIEIKSRLGTALTAKELEAIDPDSSTPGVAWKKTFIDKAKIRIAAAAAIAEPLEG